MIAGMVNRELDTRFKALERVAGLASQAMQAGPAAVQALLEQRPDLQYLFNGAVAVHDMDGTVIADFPRTGGTTRPQLHGYRRHRRRAQGRSSIDRQTDHRQDTEKPGLWHGRPDSRRRRQGHRCTE